MTAGLRSRPGSWRGAYRALVAAEGRLALRRGENLVVTIVLPAAVLVLLAAVPIGGDGIDSLLARVLASAVVATGLVALAISTAFERDDGALRRLALSPAPTSAVVASRATIVVATVAAQAVLLVAVASVVGWRPSPGVFVIVLPLLLGTVAHAAAGLALAFTLRADAVLALANAVFVILLLGGGLVVPLGALPAPLAAVTGPLPPAVLAAALDGALRRELPAPSILGLAMWAAALTAAALIAARRGGGLGRG